MQRAHTTGIPSELLLPDEMAQADRISISQGPFSGYDLMANAGSAIAAIALERYPGATAFDVLCGPGNNGGDGYVIARLLQHHGARVVVWADTPPKARTDAARAAQDCPVQVRPLGSFVPTAGGVVIDALFGAGLGRDLAGSAAVAAKSCSNVGSTVVSVDLPSGVSGNSGQMLGAAFQADLTVTFFRPKPGHLLEPGRTLCGETVVVDIGIGDSVLQTIQPMAFVNQPQLWTQNLPQPRRSQHKYSRGSVAVFSGGVTSSGAARLSAMAAARVGAGAVTVLSPASAVTTNAAHLTSIMLARVETPDEMNAAFANRQPDAVVVGPGYGLHRPITEMVLAVLKSLSGGTVVLDADALTDFRSDPATLFDAVALSSVNVVLTPHEGEFARLFPDLAGDAALSKLHKARTAAKRVGGVVVYKGPDTVIAAPDGRSAINANGSPYLATAGSGDVLSGIIAGLAAQGMPVFESTCAAVWLHAEAATRFGPGLIAEDLPGLLPPLLGELMG
jgi:hydroxyethylthiazole kinase-like uncharacterized protein yjeF